MWFGRWQNIQNVCRTKTDKEADGFPRGLCAAGWKPSALVFPSNLVYNFTVMKEYVVFDLEWNQNPYGKELPGAHLTFEIIEIGAVKLNENMEVISTFSQLVRPQVYRELHYKISQVTHMTTDELMEKGRPFQEVMADFEEWCGEAAVYCTWGPMDLTELEKNLAYFGMENPFPNPLLYYDIQKLYGLFRKDGKEKSALDTAVRELGIPEERPFHQAFDDACYTAEVMKCLDWEKAEPYISMDYYRLPQNRKEEVFLRFPGYTKYVSRVFDTREDAIADRRVTDMVCTICQKTMKKKIRWFPSGQRAYLCLSGCKDHGLHKGKIRIKKAENGQVFVVKTIKPVDEAGAAEISLKKEEERKKRNERNRQKRLERKKHKKEA